MDKSRKESLPENRLPGNVNLRMEHISKRFPGVKALQDVHLEIREGEIHALVGENGAGKSTLMKILAGVYRPDNGTIELFSKLVVIDNPNKARALGISIIHQELNLSPNLTVAENIFMGREPHAPFGWIDFRHMNQDTQEVLEQIGATFSPSTRIGRLSIAQQQLVEISRALSENARIVVMDEPTASLTGRETKKLFEIMHTLKSRGITIIYISHRMAEIYELADRATVLRDGQYVDTMERADINDSKLIQSMVGREINDLYKHEAVETGDIVLEVRDLSDREYIQGANLMLRRGEIVGLAGLIGAGRTELARLMFGADHHTTGEIKVDGKSVPINSTIDAIRAGIGLVPESRKEQGLFLQLAVQENIAMNTMSKMTISGLLNMRRIHNTAQEQVDNLGIRLASLKQRVLNLSGGNQQKVVLARWLTIKPKVLLLDEPTRGVDVGAKAEIYRIMSTLAHSGVAILMISSELPEVLGMSDRILVMHEGRITAELPGRTTTQEEIMTHAAGLAVRT